MTWSEAMAWCFTKGQPPTIQQLTDLYDNGTLVDSPTSASYAIGNLNIWTSQRSPTDSSYVKVVNFKSGGTTGVWPSYGNDTIAIKPVD